jgi:predicted dehydrogenase
VEDTVRMFLRSRSGVMASIDLSWSINKELDWYLSLFGSHGTAVVGWKESRYKAHSSREWVVFGKGYDKVQAFRDEVRNFARAVRNDESLLITAQDALASVETIEAAYRSLKESRWMPLETR